MLKGRAVRISEFTLNFLFMLKSCEDKRFGKKYTKAALLQQSVRQPLGNCALFILFYFSSLIFYFIFYVEGAVTFLKSYSRYLKVSKEY